MSAVHTPLQGSVDNFDALLDDDHHDDTAEDHDEGSVVSSNSNITAQNSWSPGTQHNSIIDNSRHHEYQVDDDDLASPQLHHVEESPKIHNTDNLDTASISSLPSYNQVMMENKEQQRSVKKKIIPVQSDSSESSPSSPSESPQPQTISLSSRYRRSQQQQSEPQLLEVPPEPQLGQKLKNSFSKYQLIDASEYSNTCCS